MPKPKVYNDSKQEWQGYYQHEYVDFYSFDVFGWDDAACLYPEMMYLPAIEFNVYSYEGGDWWAPGEPHHATPLDKPVAV